MKFDKSNQLSARAHRIIPGGCHTYAKGDDQYPVLAPGFLVRGEGSHVWDADGNEFIEYGSGNRAVGLGHAFPSVVKAAQEEIARGVNFTRPAPLEVECAEQMLSMIPAAEMVKFAKDGSAVTTAALKLARAATGRDLVACCADHPFFATNDWFIGTTPLDAGIPQAIKEMTLQFRYNDIASVQRLFDRHPRKIAALILEPAKYAHPENRFLHQVKELCHKNGALFILDEMITGFRWHNGGAQTYYEIEPDLSCFGKALANGFALSALVGKREYMELGGLTHNKERVFLLSTTHGAETSGLAAGLETMRVYQREPVIETIWRQGEKLKQGIEEVVRRQGLQNVFELVGLPCCVIHTAKNAEGESSQAFRSLFIQEMAKRGVLATTFIVGYSHSDEDLEKTIAAAEESLEVYSRALSDGVENYLVGRPSQSVYRRYNHETESSTATPVSAPTGEAIHPTGVR